MKFLRREPAAAVLEHEVAALFSFFIGMLFMERCSCDLRVCHDAWSSEIEDREL